MIKSSTNLLNYIWIVTRCLLFVFFVLFISFVVLLVIADSVGRMEFSWIWWFIVMGAVKQWSEYEGFAFLDGRNAVTIFLSLIWTFLVGVYCSILVLLQANALAFLPRKWFKAFEEWVFFHHY